MPRDIKLLEDELPPDIGYQALLKAISYSTVDASPIGSRTPGWIGETVFLASTKQFFRAKGLTNADWYAENEAS